MYQYSDDDEEDAFDRMFHETYGDMADELIEQEQQARQEQENEG